MLVGNCQCGNCKETSREYDEEYGQDYVSFECEECGYYWEGYVSLTLSDKLECSINECPFNENGVYCSNSILPYENPCWDSDPVFEDEKEAKIVNWIPHQKEDEEIFS